MVAPSAHRIDDASPRRQRGGHALKLLTLGALAAPASTRAQGSVTACTGGGRDDCIDMASCTVNIEGHTYDLSGLQQPQGNTADAGSGDGDYDYTLNPCVAVAAPTGCATVNQCEGAGSTGCSSFQHTADGSFCYAAGDASTLSASFLDPSSGEVGDPSQGLTLRWGSPLSTCGTAGIYRQTVARLICGSNGQLGQGIELPPVNSCEYQVFWNTPAGCPVSLAWGFYFLIFFSISTVGYFGGGYAYNVKQKGLSGPDAVPQYEYWESLPDLVKDGFYWSVEKAQTLQTGKEGYEEIKHSTDQQDSL